MDEKQRLEFLIQKYLKNNCSKEEFAELLRRSADPENATVLEKGLTVLWEGYDDKKPAKKVEWDQKYKSIIEFAQNYPVEQPPRNTVISWMPLLRAAVIVLVIFGTAVILWRSSAPPQKQVLAAGATPKKANTVPHNRQVLKLPDGSTVILNTDSRLVYPPDFKSATRDVYLSGEAYFDIKHNPAKPFIVHTGSVTTKVLGTAFNISAYRSQAFVTVTVTRGKVEVKRKRKLLGVLGQNDQIVYNAATEVATKKSVHTDTVVSWKNDELYFDNISFSEAALILSNKFNVTITFQDERIRNCEFTAAFKNDATLDLVLRVLGQLNNVSYSIDKNNVFISGRGCE